MTGPGPLIDSQGRILRDLRLSVTDRCNLRCLYCLPESDAAEDFYRDRGAATSSPSPVLPQWIPRSQLLSFEEIERIVCLAVGLGIRKVRLTGGEPLLRRRLERLVARIAAIPGLDDLALTTNGLLFSRQALALRAAGLRRVSFSLDSLTPDNFRRITGSDGLNDVLGGISLAQELGLRPVKVNSVIIRGLNDHEIEALAQFALERELSLRFIEFMPLDPGRPWRPQMVVSGREIVDRLQSHFPLMPLPPDDPSATARRWALPGGRAELGIIAPVTEPFCCHCNRLRLTADGKLRTCLFGLREHDLHGLLRGGAADDEIAAWLKAVVRQKEPRHQIGEPRFAPPPRSMSCIGG